MTGTAYEGNKGAANRAAINSTPESLLSTLNISSDTSKVDVTLETATKSGLNYNEVTSVIKNIPNATRLSAGVITSAEHTSLVETIPNKLVELETELNNKQDTLVSGTNIKTINGTSLLGSGNITIETPEVITDVLDNKIYGRTQGSWVDLTDYLT